MKLKLALSAVALFGLAGCIEDTASVSSGTPTPAEQACLRDVSRAANNGDVIVQSSSFSEAGTEVIVGVGAGEYGRAPWRCIAYRDGTTAGIEYIGGGEGGL
ncbi:hypothetical protein SAMN05444722_2452 [Rhodovulum sp. ES.010]|uniref:hypothetical protein n=1 Tax=Rhodovulum sp. ES.010 TaxID=1882821 RepID=UPI00092899C5|nr:hypothetical protein [Rhodovulum sp. ES.010]SIO47763.1 hypothetical protein SAMN05444722_2452 [Rhodovulum sp. ES.010]